MSYYRIDIEWGNSEKPLDKTVELCYHTSSQVVRVLTRSQGSPYRNCYKGFMNLSSLLYQQPAKRSQEYIRLRQIAMSRYRCNNLC